MKHLISFLFIVIWISGIVIAKGFWSTLFAVTIVPFWSFYLVIELIITKLVGTI